MGAQVEELRPEDLPVAGHHQDVGAEARELGHEPGVLGGGRLEDGQAGVVGERRQLGP